MKIQADNVLKSVKYNFFPHDPNQVVKELGAERLLDALWEMLLIRTFETRAEAAYLQGKVGGFFHSYVGQEAIQTAAVAAMGKENWWATSYRCHALALLLGATPNAIMAELFGRSTGNAQGRGGSMHLYTERLMGGFGIVGGQIPVATGAAFAIKYKEISNQAAICFMGDGAVPQGAFHESLNLASLWNLPAIYVIENNMWGMGTAFCRANAVGLIAESKAPGYNMKAYTFDGMDYLNCYAGFKAVFEEVVTTQRPVLIEVIAERFKGHSISDPMIYRTKESLKESMKRDPIVRLKEQMIEFGLLDEETFAQKEKELRDLCAAAAKFAEESPWPDLTTLEEDVYA